MFVFGTDADDSFLWTWIVLFNHFALNEVLIVEFAICASNECLAIGVMEEQLANVDLSALPIEESPLAVLLDVAVLGDI